MILIALGSNMQGPWGMPEETLLRALAEMQANKINIRRVSAFLTTKPFGVTDQPDFVNAVARVETRLGPEDLMLLLHNIERQAGRERLTRWGPRTLDLDLLDYNGLLRQPTVNPITTLELPHPGIAERDFVLKPLMEIAPRWKHPVTHKTAALMFRQLQSLNRD